MTYCDEDDKELGKFELRPDALSDGDLFYYFIANSGAVLNCWHAKKISERLGQLNAQLLRGY